MATRNQARKIVSKRTYLAYVIRAHQPGKKVMVKIGHTCQLEGRLRTLQTGNPYELTVVKAFLCASKEEATATEIALRGALADYAMHGEWLLLPRAAYTVLTEAASSEKALAVFVTGEV